MDRFIDILKEAKPTDLVCRCHGVSVDDLLSLAKFNQSAPESELLKKLKIGTSCTKCLKTNCKDTGRCDTHYKDVLRS